MSASYALRPAPFSESLADAHRAVAWARTRAGELGIDPVQVFVAGSSAGGHLALSAALTLAVYAAEDAFQKLPIQWMWWSAIGGLIIGIGG